MDHRVIAVIFLLAIVVVVAYYLLTAGKLRLATVGRFHPIQVEPSAKPFFATTADLVMANSAPPSRPDEMVVREWKDGRATLIVRERSGRGCASGQLIVWSSKKKKRIQDSLYDLGQLKLEGKAFGEAMVEEFLELAQKRLQELGIQGAQLKTKRKRAKGGSDAAMEVAAASVPALPEAQAPLPEAAAAPMGEAATPPGAAALAEPAATPCKYPSVSRGVILKIGMMDRIGQGGDEIQCFGVLLKTPEGIVDPVWGTHLRTTLREVGAGVGDRVEIVKVGRKTIDQGKAPMNLYQVTKLSQ